MAGLSQIEQAVEMIKDAAELAVDTGDLEKHQGKYLQYQADSILNYLQVHYKGV